MKADAGGVRWNLKRRRGLTQRKKLSRMMSHCDSLMTATAGQRALGCRHRKQCNYSGCQWRRWPWARTNRRLAERIPQTA